MFALQSKHNLQKEYSGTFPLLSFFFWPAGQKKNDKIHEYATFGHEAYQHYLIRDASASASFWAVAIASSTDVPALSTFAKLVITIWPNSWKL